jgi:hypothetical protein
MIALLVDQTGSRRQDWVYSQQSLLKQKLDTREYFLLMGELLEIMTGHMTPIAYETRRPSNHLCAQMKHSRLLRRWRIRGRCLI